MTIILSAIAGIAVFLLFRWVWKRGLGEMALSLLNKFFGKYVTFN